MLGRGLWLGVAALIGGAVPAAADKITLNVTFQNETGVQGSGTIDESAEDDDDNRLPTDVPGHTHVTAAPAYFNPNFFVPNAYFDVRLTLADGRQCSARYVIYDNNCSRTGLSSRGSVVCDSASSWSGTTCGIAIKIDD